jgi:hypothetical protein
VLWQPRSEYVSPVEPRLLQWRHVNWTWSFEFVPIPSSAIACSLRAEKPDWARSTELRRIENGRASTSTSAATVFVFVPCLSPSV